MLEKLMQNLKQAMKDKDILAKIVISLVIGKGKGYAKDDKVEVTNEHIIKALKSELKQTQDALDILVKHNAHPNQIEELELKIAFIKTYLPNELSKEELQLLVEKVGESINIEKNPRNVGILMKEIKGQNVEGIDGRMLLEVVKEYLSK